MAMGTRKHRERQEELWVAHTELATAPGHPFYERLNEVLEAERFDAFVESRCARFYATGIGRPGLTPGIYFRSLLIGYFEGIGHVPFIIAQQAKHAGSGDDGNSALGREAGKHVA
jgi:transposase